MTKRQLIDKLLDGDQEMEVYVFLPSADDDFPISDVTIISPGDGDDFVRLSYRGE